MWLESTLLGVRAQHVLVAVGTLLFVVGITIAMVGPNLVATTPGPSTPADDPTATQTPSDMVSVSMILYLDNPSTIRGATLGIDNLVWVVSSAVAVALVPFMLLLSYILRIATVAKRTLAIGPFVLREFTRSADSDRRG